MLSLGSGGSLEELAMKQQLLSALYEQEDYDALIKGGYPPPLGFNTWDDAIYAKKVKSKKEENNKKRMEIAGQIHKASYVSQFKTRDKNFLDAYYTYNNITRPSDLMCSLGEEYAKNDIGDGRWEYLRDISNRITDFRNQQLLLLQRTLNRGDYFESTYLNNILCPEINSDHKNRKLAFYKRPYSVFTKEEIDEFKRHNEYNKSHANSLTKEIKWESPLYSFVNRHPFIRKCPSLDLKVAFYVLNEQYDRLVKETEHEYSLKMKSTNNIAKVGKIEEEMKKKLRDLKDEYWLLIGYTRDELQRRGSTGFREPEEAYTEKSLFPFLEGRSSFLKGKKNVEKAIEEFKSRPQFSDPRYEYRTMPEFFNALYIILGEYVELNPSYTIKSQYAQKISDRKRDNRRNRVDKNSGLRGLEEERDYILQRYENIDTIRTAIIEGNVITVTELADLLNEIALGMRYTYEAAVSETSDARQIIISMRYNRAHDMKHCKTTLHCEDYLKHTAYSNQYDQTGYEADPNIKFKGDNKADPNEGEKHVTCYDDDDTLDYNSYL